MPGLPTLRRHSPNEVVTLPGVGIGVNPPVYLQNRDVKELKIEGLGRQRQADRQA